MGRIRKKRMIAIPFSTSRRDKSRYGERGRGKGLDDGAEDDPMQVESGALGNSGVRKGRYISAAITFVV